MRKKLTASIVVYNSDKVLLEKTVDSLSLSGLCEELTIVDNSPRADLGSFCREKGIRYIFNGRNIGYGAAHNIVIKKAMEERGHYHLVLNPDIYFKKGTLEALYGFMEDNPDVGLVVPKTLNPDGTVQFLCKLLPCPMNLIFRRFWPGARSCYDKIQYNYELRFTGYDRIMEVPYLSGSFMFLRLESLEKAGLFDENILLYLEDTDLTRRIHGHFKTIYYPMVSVYHEHGKESYRSFRAMLLHIRSAIAYFNKWGWFFDRGRMEINRQILRKLSSEGDGN